MKKLLAIVMVLGLATVANAAMSLHLNGTALEIWTSGDTAAAMSFALLGKVSGGALASTALSADTSLFGPNDMSGNGYGLYAAGGAEGISGSIALSLTATAFPTGVAISGIAYQGGPALLYLVDPDTLDITGDPLEGSIVPEPITMSLLGLGGLVALRRRMA